MQPIKDWLNGVKDYDEGVALYNTFGHDRQMKNLFKEYRTAFKEKKLYTLLRGLLNAGDTVKEKKQQKEKELAKHGTVGGYGWPKKMDTELLALHAQWKPLYAEFMNLTHRIYDVANLGVYDKAKEMEAGQMAHQILKLRDEIKDIYYFRDHYREHKKFPAREQAFVPVISDPVKIAERRLNLKRYMVRLYNILQKPEKSEKTRINQVKKFNEYKQEMLWINEQLKKPMYESIPGENK